MKYNKYLSIIILLVSVILIITSCTDQIEIPNTISTSTETPDSQETDFLLNSGFIPNSVNVAIIDQLYSKFEGHVYCANNVIQAKFESVDYYERFCEYKFLVEKQYKGHIEEEYIYVKNMYSRTSVNAPGASISYVSYETSFNQGESYVLVLEASSLDIYDPYRPYLLLGNLVIPVDNLSKSTIYGGHPLSEHSDIGEGNLSKYNLFIEYLNSCIKQYDGSKEPIDVTYITSEKIEDVVSGSEYIIKIKITKKESSNERYERYYCEILGNHKGEIDLKEVEIDFFPGTVKVGKEYIVAINSISPNIDDLFYLSSKNSVFDLKHESEIVNLIDNIENP